MCQQDDRYFLSGALDGKLRLWNIPDKKVTLWNELSGSSNLITTANFCHNGRLAVVGTYDGKCIFYTTEVRGGNKLIVIFFCSLSKKKKNTENKLLFQFKPFEIIS